MKCNKFDAAAPVFVSVTRSRNEAVTTANLRKDDVPHVGTSGDSLKCDGDCDNCKDGKDIVKQILGATAPKAATKPEPKVKRGAKCTYCGKELPLMPIPGFNICVSCAQIELGVRRNKDAKNVDPTSNT